MARKRLPPKPPNKERPPLCQSPGAPPLDINVDEVKRLARLGMTTPNLAQFFGCSESTILNRVSHAELTSLRAERPNKLRDALYMRAMGGKVEERQPDGTIIVRYLKSSDRMMECAMRYFVGAPPQVIELNPNPEAPQNVRHSVDKDQLKAVIRELNEEY